LATEDALNSGVLTYPSHSRFWVAGDVTTSSPDTLNGLFYDALGTFTATDDLNMYGSVFTGYYDGQSATNIHYDQAAAESGQECPENPPPASCGATQGQACSVDTDCCQPLYCLPDTHTCGFIVE